MSKAFFYALNVVLLVGLARGFSEESIFDDEDIYKQALPPTNHTGITLPGTKWCGPGNTANNYDDLGTQREVDKCCRAHDHCDDIMEAKTSLHGLNNPDWFPILKCSCEQEFINCLKTVNSMASIGLGRLYYGSRSKCFSLGHPIVDCTEYFDGHVQSRCVRYSVDKTRARQWQLYDMPFFSISADILGRLVMGKVMSG